MVCLPDDLTASTVVCLVVFFFGDICYSHYIAHKHTCKFYNEIMIWSYNFNSKINASIAFWHVKIL